ncbi:MAG: GHKL domain-containing protein [Tannerellaceae bacterium]|jgi:signal transduction histidine kinase|nr:GHKL domain-containing protein [Tannerellaceae bacterium]
MSHRFFDTLAFRLSTLVVMTVGGTLLVIGGRWLPACAAVFLAVHAGVCVHRLSVRNARKISFMFDAIDNADHAFRYAESGRSSADSLVNRSLNRIIQILFRAKADAMQKEKYYELILDSVNTGIITLAPGGYVFQTNNEALRLLGLSVLTHVKQLRRLGEGVDIIFSDILPGSRRQVSFTNERGAVNLSVRASSAVLKGRDMRILAINDINSELDDREIDSWTRLTRVLTHEIMNGITPITSLSSTLLTLHGEGGNEDLRSGLETINVTGRNLMTFVESYRRFTHIPTPRPSLFYVQRFASRMIQLARHQNDYPNITLSILVTPPDLIVHADESLIGQVILNLMKNAMQAIGATSHDGRIELRAACNADETVTIEVINNGPAIPKDEAAMIFVPFFSTKQGGSGIGLSISRQIMRLSGGALTMKTTPQETTFTLTLP